MHCGASPSQACACSQSLAMSTLHQFTTRLAVPSLPVARSRSRSVSVLDGAGYGQDFQVPRRGISGSSDANERIPRPIPGNAMPMAAPQALQSCSKLSFLARLENRRKPNTGGGIRTHTELPPRGFQVLSVYRECDIGLMLA